MLMNVIQTLVFYPLDTRVQPGDSHRVQGSVFQPVRVFVQMGANSRADTRPAGAGVSDFDSFSHVQTADSRRTQQRFMTGENHNIRIQFFHIDGNFSGGLRDIDRKRDAHFLAILADVFDRLDCADHIGRMIDNNKLCVFFKFFREFAGIHKSLAVEGNVIHFDIVILIEVVERTQHGIVVDVGGYGMISFLKQAVYNQVQSVGGVVRKTKTIGIRAIKKLGHHGSGFFHKLSCFHAEVISRTPWIDAKISVEMIHEAVDFLRFRERGGSIIKKYKIAHS